MKTHTNRFAALTTVAAVRGALIAMALAACPGTAVAQDPEPQTMPISTVDVGAGRMIRPMDQHMAVQAGTSARLNTRSGRSRLLETIGRRHVAARQIGAAVDLIAMVTAV